jgi:two-component system, NarL family, response regulator DevR
MTTASLSAESRRVLQLVATGLSTPEIAERLAMPVADVRHYLNDALSTLGMSSRLSAVIMAVQRGLIDLPR